MESGQELRLRDLRARGSADGRGGGGGELLRAGDGRGRGGVGGGGGGEGGGGGGEGATVALRVERPADQREQEVRGAARGEEGGALEEDESRRGRHRGRRRERRRRSSGRRRRGSRSFGCDALLLLLLLLPLWRGGRDHVRAHGPEGRERRGLELGFPLLSVVKRSIEFLRSRFHESCHLVSLDLEGNRKNSKDKKKNSETNSPSSRYPR